MSPEPSILAARSLIETGAVLNEFVSSLGTAVAASDMAAVDKLVMHQTFASRDPEFTKRHPETAAKSILHYIDKMAKLIPGIRTHYDSLSEICHPNSWGHRQFFSSTDKTNGTVTYSESKAIPRSLIRILPACSMVELAETNFAEIDRLVVQVAALNESHRARK
jgi:hypothetical protein